jgi:putative inorganic carbon (HCO3(-)) transporter
MTRERLQAFCDQGVRITLMAMLLVVPLVFYIYCNDVFETNKLFAFRILTLMALTAFLTRFLLVDSNRKLRPSLLWPPVLLVGISSLLSTLHTNNLQSSLFGVYEDFEGIFTIANYLLLWVLVNQFIRNLNDSLKFLLMVVLAGLVAAIYGVVQNFGIDIVAWNPMTYSAGRLFGSLGNPNFLAAYVLMALPVATVFFLIAKRTMFKAGMLATVAIMLMAIFFTKSRGAFYGLSAEFVLLAGYLIYDRNKGGLVAANRRWLILTACLAGLLLCSGQVRSTIGETVDRTLQTLNVKQLTITPRLYIWRSALQMIRDNPVLGTGLDTFQIAFPKYRLAEYWQLEWNGTPEKAHNFFLQIGATTGLLGLGAWLWLITAFFLAIVRKWKDLNPLRRHLSVAVMLAEVGFLIQNQFSFTVVAYGSLFWFFLALGPALDRDDKPAEAPVKPEPFSLQQVSLGRWAAYMMLCGLILATVLLSSRLWMADMFFKRAMVYLAGGYSQPAIAEMARAVELDPYREIYWVKYGIAIEEAAKAAPDKVPLLQQAVKIHEHTIAMNPLNGYDYNNLGRVYKFWGDFVDRSKLPEAEKACRQATVLDPYNVYFALDLASVYLSQQRPDQAKAIAQHLIELFPDFAQPYSYLGYVALLKGDAEEAYRRLNEAAIRNWRGDANTCSSTWSNLGIVRARRGELEGALQAFQKALELRPQYIEARMNMALILEQLNRKQEAATEYKFILNQAPQYPQAAELKRKIEILERGTL